MSEAQVARIKQEIGLPVSDFSLAVVGNSTGSSAPMTLADVLAGKKGAVVVFWSGVCSHCVRYDDYLNSFAERHPDIGFAAIASRQSETEENVRQTIAQRGLKFPILHDSKGVVAGQWYTQQTPRCFVIGPDRTLLYRGALDNFKAPTDPEFAAYLEPAVASLSKGEPIARTETASFGCAIQSVYYILPKPI
jgi:thiol-disulfide isomerase/thioredoxin